MADNGTMGARILRNCIKAYVGYDERTNTKSYRRFWIADKLPRIGDVWNETMEEKVTYVEKAIISYRQDGDEIPLYNFYKLGTEDFEHEKDTHYICVKKKGAK